MFRTHNTDLSLERPVAYHVHLDLIYFAGFNYVIVRINRERYKLSGNVTVGVPLNKNE
jgi:hypothetical protein